MSGETLLEKRRYVRDHLDSLRTALIHEPRGHNDMYGALLVEPDREDADLAVLFLHKQGFESFCLKGDISQTFNYHRHIFTCRV